jgi:hypothetical protein
MLRHLLGPLVEEFVLDEPEKGLVAIIPVVGGVFMHPLTREPVPRLKVYGAGSNRVKILEPKFLASLGQMGVAGLSHASQFCAQVANSLGEVLTVLGKIRDQVAALGITLDLEHDVLRLKGLVELQGFDVELTAWQTGKLVIRSLGEHDVTGLVPRTERTLNLTGQPTTDLDELLKLTRSLDERIRRETLEEVERSLGIRGEPEHAPVQTAVEPATAVEAGTGQASTGPQEQEGAATNGDSQERPDPAPGFAKGTSDVLELTELVEEETGASEPESSAFDSAPPASPVSLPDDQNELAPEPASEPVLEPVPEPEKMPTSPAAPADVKERALPAVSLGPLPVRDLFEKLGSETKVSAHNGSLRMEVPLKVIQGTYVFYLEQMGQTLFRGVVQTPTGARHPVEFDLRGILDLKEVLDRVLLGK